MHTPESLCYWSWHQIDGGPTMCPFHVKETMIHVSRAKETLIHGFYRLASWSIAGGKESIIWKSALKWLFAAGWAQSFQSSISYPSGALRGRDVSWERDRAQSTLITYWLKHTGKGSEWQLKSLPHASGGNGCHWSSIHPKIPHIEYRVTRI